jgi:hypothetical protein
LYPEEGSNPALFVIEEKMLIHQIRSLGSLGKGYGVHAGHSTARKPEVSFKAPTYPIGGSNFSSTRQGGFLLVQ